MQMQRLKIHHIDPVSYANGPGRRYTIWLQGCGIQCPGCFNPQTHDPNHGNWQSISSILNDVNHHLPVICGITISGGEPLDQAKALTALLEPCKMVYQLPIILFSGYTFEQIQADEEKKNILQWIDVLIAGPYQPSQHNQSGFPGSHNQEIIFLTDIYSMTDFTALPPAEVTISQTGDLLLSGTDPLLYRF